MKLSHSLLLVILMLISDYGYTQSVWTAIDEVDPFTDEGIKAVVYEDAVHRIQINAETESSIAMYLSRKQGTFEPNTTLELRIDKNPLVDFSPDGKMFDKIMIEAVGMPSYRWSPSSLVVLFAAISTLNPENQSEISKATNSCTGVMTQFLNGEKLIGRYHVSDTSRETFSVSLEGFKEAANQLFDIADTNNNNPHCLR